MLCLLGKGRSFEGVGIKEADFCVIQTWLDFDGGMLA